MPTIETNGFETYYERHGEGPPIVFSHGSSWDHRSWMPQVRGLSTDYEVIVYDVRGHGKTGVTGVELEALPGLADDLKALVDGLGLESPVVVGCSMGGRIAYTYAARYPSALDGLVALEPPVTDDGRPLKWRLFVRAMQTVAAVVGPDRALQAHLAAFSLLSGDDEYGDQRVPDLGMTKSEYIASAQSQMAGEEQLRMGTAARVGADLSSIAVPTLVLTGANPADRFDEAAATLLERVPDARRETIPDAGHGAHMDHPVEFNRAVRLFLREVFGSTGK